MKQIKINEKDNVAVMLEGELSGHKIALNDIKKGENIIKYGYPIGHATEDIKKGDHVHTHNIKTNLSGVLEYKYEPQRNEMPKTEKRTFMGYRRADGKVGIRNEIWIVNTVGCVNKTSEILAREADKLYGDMCDGVFNYVHPFGCSQLGDDQKSAPPSRPASLSYSSPRAVRMMTGVLMRRVRISRRQVMPSMKGIIRSRMTRS